jgi:hypothetical protein
VCLAVLLAACGRGGFVSIDGGPGSGSAGVPITVGPLYEAAPGFTDWIENDGVDMFSAAGIACDGDLLVAGVERGRSACLPAGPLRAAVLAGTSCDGVAAQDTLGALDWVCEQRDADALIHSTGLHVGISLRDLLDAAGWRANTLEVRLDDTLIAQSDGTAFWSNTVVSLHDTVATDVRLELSGAKTIYTLDEDRALPAVTLEAPGSAFVTLGSATLSPSSQQNGCASSPAGTLDTPCAIAVAPGAPFTVVSARIDTIGTGVLAVTPSFLTIVSSTVRNAATGIDIRDGGANEIVGSDLSDVISGIVLSNGAYDAVLGSRVVSKGSGTGIALDGGRNQTIADTTVIGAYDNVVVNASPKARLHDVETVHAGEFGVYVGQSPDVLVTDLVATSNGFDAIRFIDGSERPTIVGALVANNGGEGVNVWGVTHATVSHITAIADFQFGVSIYLGSNYASVSQINAVNSGDYGLFVRGSSYGLFSQIAVTNNAFQQSRIYQNSDFNTFVGAYIGGQSQVCVVDGGGVDNNTIVTDGAGGICGGDNATYNFRSLGSLTQATTFGGLVTSDSTNANASALAQPVDPATITDWTNFDSRYRFWGRGASTSFLDGTNRLNCVAPNLCHVWDASLTSASPMFNTSGTGRTQNEPFVDGGPCPSAVQGDFTMHDLRGAEIAGDGIGDDDGVCEVFEKCDAQSIYLTNARELIEDGIGDDDGLCESNEACSYSPNFGYYQGDGALTKRCVFSPGTGAFAVTNVTLYGR